MSRDQTLVRTGHPWAPGLRGAAPAVPIRPLGRRSDPPQDLGADPTRMPTRPASGVVLTR